jgi:hypothetical protein
MAYRDSRDAGGFGHGFREHAFLRALTQLARQQAHQKVLFGFSRAAEQRDELLRPRTCRTRTSDIRKPLERIVNLSQLERGRRRRRHRSRLRDDRPTDADAPLRERAGQVRNCDGNFVGKESSQQIRQLADFVETPARTCNVIRHIDQLLQPHPSMLQPQVCDLFALETGPIA